MGGSDFSNCTATFVCLCTHLAKGVGHGLGELGEEQVIRGWRG